MELKPEQVIASTSENVGLFTIKPANELMQEAAMRPNPVPLWKNLWYEGEVCCLFSDSNLGKSIYAVQIATEIAKHEKVLLFDFELSDKQFQMRYTDDFGNLYHFPDNLFRVEINKEALDTDTFIDSMISNIEQAAIQTGAKVLIIDNLTYMCLDSEKGKDAGVLMMKLMALKKKLGLSIIVLAHTPKRNMQNPITQNDLAGSKKLFNFFDAVFAIGQSAKEPKLRYIKELKARSGEIIYHSENVLLVSINKNGSFLQFEEQGFAKEREHLREKVDMSDSILPQQVLDLREQRKSYREIGEILGINKNKVGELLTRHLSTDI